MRYARTVLSSGLMTLCASGAAFAQNTLSSAIEEVIVTAQRRAESLQEVPISISVLGEDDLMRNGVQSIEDLTKIAPELRADQAGAFSIVAVRGIRPNSFGPMAEGATAFHIDGNYSPRLLGLNGFYYDLERIEILAGPQGTLFGRNAQAGAINVIAKKPDIGMFGGSVELEGGSYDTQRVHGALNIPLGDRMAMRVAGRYYSTGGHMKDSDMGDINEKALRVSFKAQFTDQTTLLLTGDDQREGGNGTTLNTWLADGASANLVALLPNDPYKQKVLIGDGAYYDRDNEYRGLAAQVDHDFGFAALTVQASVREGFTDEQTGQSANGWINPTADPSHTSEKDEYQWTQYEARLASPGGQQLEWLIGVQRFQDRLMSDHGGQAVYCITQALCPPGFTANVDDIAGIDWYDQDSLSKSIFGQATWTPPSLDSLHVTFGLRYNDDEKWSSGTYVQRGSTYPFPILTYIAYPDQNNPPPANPAAAYRNWKQTTYTAKVAYELTPSNMIYVSNGTGYKGGTFAYGATPEAPPGLSTLYEFGSKNAFFSNRLQVNFAIWRMDFEDYETTLFTFNPVANANFLETESADKARADGFQIDVTALLTSKDRVRVNAIHSDNKYIDFDARKSLPPGALNASDFSGTPMGNVADWVASVAYNHVFSFPGNSTLDVGLNFQYETDRYLFGQITTDEWNAPHDAAWHLRNPSGGGKKLIDLTLRYAPASENWDFTLYGRNLTDEEYLISRAALNTYRNRPDTNGDGILETYTAVVAQYGAPRTWGAQFGYRF